MENEPKVVFLLCRLFGGALLIMLIIGAFREVQLSTSGLRATGTVIEHLHSRSKAEYTEDDGQLLAESQDQYTAVVQFDYEGQSYRAYGEHYASTPSPATGEPVEVVFLSSDPGGVNRFAADLGGYFGYLAGLLLGGVIFAIPSIVRAAMK